MAGSSRSEDNHSDAGVGVGALDSCIFCGSSSSSTVSNNPGNAKTKKHWSTWKADCGRSLCSLLSVSDTSIQYMMTVGPYCRQCSTLVWDIHFTMKQIKTLESRLKSLKANVE